MLYLDALLPLANHQEPPAVSLFIPGQSALLMQAALTNILKSLSSSLSEHLSPSEITDFLAPISALLTDPTVWSERKAGLAIFRSPTFSLLIHTPHPLPLQTVIDEHFHLLPLVPYLEQSQCFHILDLGTKIPALYDANAFNFSQITFQLEGSQWKQEVLTLLHKSRTPLILVGTPQKRARFLASVSYPFCTHTHLTIPSKSSATRSKSPIPRQQMLQEAFLKNLDHFLEESRKQAWEGLINLQRTNKTLSNIREVTNAAYNSRIDALFINISGVTLQSLGLENGDESQSLVNLAASHTLLNKGRIYPLPPQQAGPVAATLRY